MDLRHRSLGTCPFASSPDLEASSRDFSDTDRVKKKKDLEAEASKSLIRLNYLGSPTWARTRDLRINSRGLADLVGLHGTSWDC